MSNERPNWGHQPVTLDEWKAMCEASSHIRHGDVLTFKEPNRIGVIDCWIQGTSVFLGAYFTKADGNSIQAGTGWCHS